ncbi:MAG: hypothetical protein AAFP19_02435, partial [Bacteroidota bacterium]
EQMNADLGVDILQEAIENLNRQKGESIRFKFLQNSIKVLYGIYNGDYQQIIKSCNHALQFFTDKVGVYPAYYLFFFQTKGTAQTAIGAYKKATESFQKSELYTGTNLYNHYALQYYQTLNALHAGQYSIAYERYQKNKRCKFEDIREQFAIIEAYLYFLSHTGYLQLDKTFRMRKYLNDTFKAQSDKQGSNINILIAELLVYLVRDKGKFIDRIEAVKDYSYRHLKGPETQRAKWFIKILCLLPHSKVNFHAVALRRKAGRYIELLESHPVRMGEGFAVEIIPFDRLFQMIEEKVIKKAA